ncbi:UvrD-helicase domain-containing protein [Oceanithermus desulfurans]|uniref:DNA 3'-5' helicase n=2 Tax=Oceanithermus desulfurans TaxID=227924 RepID=A0A511RKM1_9DEIN|nr:ATP-dependent helicase [Oceanithermus desulfurans]MBB6029562.1 superfamily I DNA/RNA helicase [Oceanithermus desulfurans]GEM90198.1 DNA helicase [Oceanithermus desulfurans NBRC 100063]
MSVVRPEEWQPQGVGFLEPNALRALRETERSVLVAASPGAGKTEFLAQKAAYLLQTGLCPAPKRILAISFKRDAAKNLADRVARRCSPEQARRFDSYTFDGFAKNLLDRFRAAVPEPYRPPADYHIELPDINHYRYYLNIHNLRTINAEQFARKLAEARLPLNDGGSKIIKAIQAYWNSQYNDHDHVLLTFSMINRLVELLIRENPYIRRALHLTYPVVFLDEYQDTTFAQFELLQTMFTGSNTIFTAVGDDKQRIMLWAGAMPNAFDKFENYFVARRISLNMNWRSHKDLVQIQHFIARRLDPDSVSPEARADRMSDGDIAAIWEFATIEEESDYLARWIAREVREESVEPHDIAILVRMRANRVEDRLAAAFSSHDLDLRNVARNVGNISIQDLLGEELTKILLRLLRLGATPRSPENWNASLSDLQHLEAVDPADEVAQRLLHERLQLFVRELRQTLDGLKPSRKNAKQVAIKALDFIGTSVLQRTFPSYHRQADFNRVWEGFVLLLEKSLLNTDSWAAALDKFEGIGQVPLMTIHKSKGLEFHTVIFYGLDNKSWWSLRPERPEELHSFFVAFTRAKQRAFFTLCNDSGESIPWIEELLTSAGAKKYKPSL